MRSEAIVGSSLAPQTISANGEIYYFRTDPQTVFYRPLLVILFSILFLKPASSAHTTT